MNPAIADNMSLEETQFHGASFSEERDGDRLKSSIARIAEVFQDNEGAWLNSDELCEKAEASPNSYRNRISDLRVYHGFKIDAENVKGGLWKYRFNGLMTAEEHHQYLTDLKLKRNKPMGDKDLWGEMMRSMYAFANSQEIINQITLREAAEKWAINFAWDLAKPQPIKQLSGAK